MSFLQPHAHRRLARACVNVCALTIVALSLAAPAWAADAEVWASPTGNDVTGAGTKTAPYRTITKALSIAGATDAVTLLPGRYDTAAGETFPLDVSQGEDIVCVGPGPAIIVGDRDHCVIYAASQGLASAVTIRLRGLHITGGAPGPDPLDLKQAGGGISCESMGTGDELIVEHCSIYSNLAASDKNGGGIFASTGGSWGGNAIVIVRDCVIANNEAEDGGGISMLPPFASTARLTVERCIVRDNEARSEGGGIHSQNTYTVEIKRCEITGNNATSYGGLYVTDAAAGAMNNLLVAENVADRQSGMRLRVRDTHTYWVGGSTFVDNFDAADETHWSLLAENAPGSGTAYLNGCITWDNAPAGVSGFQVLFTCTDDGTVSGTGVIHVDPLFAAPTAAHPDYHLLRTSPCIDTGNDEGTYGIDLDGWPRPMLGSGAGEALDDMGCYESSEHDTVRSAGTNRYETASVAWEPDHALVSAYTAVVASGENFPDALAASALAGVVRGPLLLTPKASLSPTVVPRLQELGVTGVYLIGGPPAVSDTVMNQLTSAGFNVTRIAGDNRYETAGKVAREVWRAEGAADSHSVFVARGDTFPDALAAAPWAYAEGIPILLTAPTSLSGVTASFISEYVVSRSVYILGSKDAVSDGVKTAIDVVDGASTPVRLGGTNRYETAAVIANAAAGSSGSLSWQSPGLATGTVFADALSGGAACGARGSVLLLTAPTSLSAQTATALTAHKAPIQRVIVLGGPPAVSDAVKDAAAALIE